MDLPNDQLSALRQVAIQPGSVILAPKEGVEHKKMYVVCGISGNRLCVCTVFINSEINPFILNRPNLRALQIEIHKSSYSFLEHRSYINCANQEHCNITELSTEDCKYLGELTNHHLAMVRSYVLKSGQLTPEEEDLYFAP